MGSCLHPAREGEVHCPSAVPSGCRASLAGEVSHLRSKVRGKSRQRVIVHRKVVHKKCPRDPETSQAPAHEIPEDYGTCLTRAHSEQRGPSRSSRGTQKRRVPPGKRPPPGRGRTCGGFFCRSAPLWSQGELCSRGSGVTG